MPSKTQSIILGGLILGIAIPFLSLVPILGVCLCCFAYVGAGMFSTWHYTDTYDLTIKGGTGASMGAASGAIAGFAAFIVTMILVGFGLIPGVEEVIQQLDDPQFREQVGPDAADQVIRMVEQYYTPISAVVNVLAGLILGLIGGIIGASVFQQGGDTPTRQADSSHVQ